MYTALSKMAAAFFVFQQFVHCMLSYAYKRYSHLYKAFRFIFKHFLVSYEYDMITNVLVPYKVYLFFVLFCFSLM